MGDVLIVPEAEYNLLGRDLIVGLKINLVVDKGEITSRLCVLTQKDEEKINPQV